MSERPRAGARRAVIVGAPIVAVATLAIGLRIGAGEAVIAGAITPGLPGLAVDGRMPFALQIMTTLDDRGVRETVPVLDLVLVARSAHGEARWTGASNADGIAEATFELDAPVGYPIAVELRDRTHVLAAGELAWADPRTTRIDRSLAPAKREGAIDVVVEGGRLAVEVPTTIWIHAAGDVTVSADPGLDLEPPHRCGPWSPWSELHATSRGFAAGIAIAGDTVHWAGAVPVAPGAYAPIGLGRVLHAGEPIVIAAPTGRRSVYVEIDDEHGRAFAAVLPLVSTSPPRAAFALPRLAPGPHWLIASGEPHAAETLAGATMAWPFTANDDPVDNRPARAEEACERAAILARHAPTGFPRGLAIDGSALASAKNRRRRAIGLAIGIGALAVAALLEAVLLVAMARAAKGRTGSVVVAVGVALLGFALLAVLVLAKA